MEVHHAAQRRCAKMNSFGMTANVRPKVDGSR